MITMLCVYYYRSDGFVVQAGDPEPEGDKVYYISYQITLILLVTVVTFITICHLTADVLACTMP
jgi:hypothetical protein